MSNLINIAEAIAAEAHNLLAAKTRIVESFLAHGHTVEVIGTSGSRMRLGTGVAVTARVTTTIEGEKIYLRGEALCSPIQDWPTFWQSLTPSEVASALRAAPRVAGEWVGFGDQWSRSDFRDGSRRIAKVWATWYGPDQFAWSSLGGPERHDAANPGAAKLAADAALRQAGWVLL